MFTKKKIESKEIVIPDKYETVIGRGMAISGIVTSTGTVKIDGIITGDVCVDTLYLDGPGLIRGNVTAKENVFINGLIEGNVTCKLIHIDSTGEVKGDVICEKIIVNQGARIDGRIQQNVQVNTEVKE